MALIHSIVHCIHTVELGRNAPYEHLITVVELAAPVRQQVVGKSHPAHFAAVVALDARIISRYKRLLIGLAWHGLVSGGRNSEGARTGFEQLFFSGLCASLVGV